VAPACSVLLAALRFLLDEGYSLSSRTAAELGTTVETRRPALLLISGQELMLSTKHGSGTIYWLDIMEVLYIIPSRWVDEDGD
jgi:hypothetical protein